MARYGTTTSATPADVLRLAVDAFGAKGLGLRLSNRDMTSARFDGPNGHIALEVSRTPDGQTAIDLETREFDDEVLTFIDSLPRPSLFRSLLERLRPRRR